MSFYFLGIFAMIFIFSSCTTDSLPGAGVSKTVHVAYMCTEPELAPRYGCSGQMLSQPKVVGWKNIVDTLPAIALFSDEDLNAKGYFYKGKNTEPAQASSEKSGDDMGWWLLAFLLLACAAVWQLYRLAECCNRRRGETAPPAAPASPAPPAPVAPAPTGALTIPKDVLSILAQNGGELDYDNVHVKVYASKQKTPKEG